MKGLLLYEFYQIKSVYGKNLIFMAVLYFVISVTLGLDAFLLMLVWMMGFYFMSTLSLEVKWNCFVRSLPVSVQQIAGSKFIAMYAMIGLGDIYALASGMIMCAVKQSAYIDFLISLAVITAVVVIFMSVMLPCAIRWGVEKVRNTMLLITAALIGCATLAMKTYDIENLLPQMESSGIVPFVVLFALAACAGGFGWLAAVRIYRNKEV